MFKHYLTTALRNLLRFKATTAITVAGLALGLSCFVAALGTLVFLTTSEDHIANADRIYVITESMHPRNVQNLDFASVRSSPPLASNLRLDFPQLEAVGSARDVQDIPVTANDRLGYLHTAAANPEFIKVFNFSFVESITENPLSIGGGAIITEATANKLFGTTHVLGRTISLQSAFDVAITGVMRDVSQPSHIGASLNNLLRFDILLTEETYWQFRRAQNPSLPSQLPFSGDSWGSPVCFTYVLLPLNKSMTARMLNSQLEGFTRRRAAPWRKTATNFQHTAVPIASIRLAQLEADMFRGNGLSLAVLILSLGGIVLVVACVNYVNITAAQSLARARELGLRRVLGASAMQIVTQQWIESGMQWLFALLLAVPLVTLCLMWFGEDATAILGRALATSTFWLAMLAASIAVVFALGAYTAFVVLRTYPAQALRASKANGSSGVVSRLLVGVQFATASLLLIGLIVVQTQNDAIRNRALKGSTDPVVVLEFPGREISSRFETLKDTLLSSSAIRDVSGIIRVPWSTKQPSVMGVSIEPGSMLRNALVDFVQHDFERALAIRILAGRSFDASFNDVTWPSTGQSVADIYPIVIDRATAMQLGWQNPSDAINRTIYWPQWAGGQLSGANARLRIIGVLEDKPLRFDAGPGAQLQIYALVPKVASNIIVRIDKNRIQEALATIDATWKTFVPYTTVQRHFMDELFEREYKTLQRTSNAMSIVTIVGTTIAVMGLFGMATFTATRRCHEIGVRKTLGATVGQIVAMLLRDFSKPVFIANLLIWPIAYLMAQRYLSLFVQRIELSALPFIGSLTFALVVAWLAVGRQAWRAARTNPASVLRTE